MGDTHQVYYSSTQHRTIVGSHLSFKGSTSCNNRRLFWRDKLRDGSPLRDDGYKLPELYP